MQALEVKELTVSSGGEFISTGSTKTRTVQSYHFPANTGKVGATAGFAFTNDTGTATVPASQTASTLTIPLSLKQGDIITGFIVSGQIESAGNTATLDADLRATTAAAGALTDASIGAITQISQTNDYLIGDAKAGLSHTVISGNSYYVLVTVTTAAATDVDLQGVQVIVTEK